MNILKQIKPNMKKNSQFPMLNINIQETAQNNIKKQKQLSIRTQNSIDNNQNQKNK